MQWDKIREMICPTFSGHLIFDIQYGCRKGVRDAGGLAVAAQIGVSHSILQGWVRQAKIDQGRIPASAGLTSRELRELAALRRENKRLKEEMDIDKRAAMLFAKGNVLPK